MDSGKISDLNRFPSVGYEERWTQPPQLDYRRKLTEKTRNIINRTRNIGLVGETSLH